MPEVMQDKPRKGRKIDKGKAIILASKGLSYNQIGKQFGTTGPAVHKALKPIFKCLLSKEELKDFRDKEVSILDSVKAKILVAAVNDGKLKKSSTLQLTTAYSQLTDKSLLLQGKATQIIESKTLIAQSARTLEEIRERLANAKIINSEGQEEDVSVDK